MSREYPRIVSRGAKPDHRTIDRHREGRRNHKVYGKPCIVCGQGTTRKVWIQVNWFRGEDEEIRVCPDCWKTPTDELINKWAESA